MINLSHELRTPLNVLHTTEQLITKLNKGGELKEEKLPNSKLSKELREDSYYYALWNPPFNNHAIWNIDEISTIDNHKDTDFIYYINHIYDEIGRAHV